MLISQSTTFMSSPFRQTATVLRQWRILTLLSVVSCTPARSKLLRRARPVIWLASMAILPPRFSPPGKNSLRVHQTETYQRSYTDDYLSTTPGSPYFFGDKSFVIHSSNATRLTCANFELVSSSSNGTNATVTGSSPTPTASIPIVTGAAVANVAGVVGAGLAAVAAFFL